MGHVYLRPHNLATALRIYFMVMLSGKKFNSYLHLVWKKK